MRTWLLVASLTTLAACGGAATRVASTPLRPACAAGERWDGAGCQPRGGTDDLATAATAFAGLETEEAMAALDRAAARPLDYPSYLSLWKQRAMVHALGDATAEAEAAFARLLAADPGHAIDCDAGARYFRPFQRAQAARPIAHELELRWRRDLRLGQAIPIEVESIADPQATMHAVTVYVRTRGEPSWRAADVTLPPPGQVAALTLPPITGREPTALELYAVASDRGGSEVHRWASPERPREIALRYDPPTPWHRKWWVWAAVGGVAAVGTGVAVYAAVWRPSDNLTGTASAR